MEPIFTTSTTYTYEKYVTYSRTLAGKVNHLYLYGTVLTLGMFLVAVLGYLNQNEDVCFIFILAGILLPFALFFRQKRAMKKMWNSNKGAQNITAKYAFYEDYFEQHNELGNSKFTYQNLYKIVEGKDAFYLLISKGQGVIIDKACCDEMAIDFIRSIQY